MPGDRLSRPPPSLGLSPIGNEEGPWGPSLSQGVCVSLCTQATSLQSDGPLQGSWVPGVQERSVGCWEPSLDTPSPTCSTRGSMVSGALQHLLSCLPVRTPDPSLGFPSIPVDTQERLCK